MISLFERLLLNFFRIREGPSLHEVEKNRSGIIKVEPYYAGFFAVRQTKITSLVLGEAIFKNPVDLRINLLTD